MDNNYGYDADWCTALVILLEGKRLNWKIVRGQTLSKWGLSNKYYHGVSPSKCNVEIRQFQGPTAYEQAEEWAREFSAHELENGMKP